VSTRRDGEAARAFFHRARATTGMKIAADEPAGRRLAVASVDLARAI
jgi:hypothetical protein